MDKSNKKILIIAPSWIGDVVMSQSLFRVLKKKYPDCVIDVLASEYLHPILKRMPEVRDPLLSVFKHGELNLSERYKVAKALEKKSYTHVYILPNSIKSALIPFWANIPNRIGWLGEYRYFLVNDIRYGRKKIDLMVERFVALGHEKGEEVEKDFLFPKLEVDPENVNLAIEKMKMHISGRPILAICPGAEHGSSKRWPWEYYAEVAKEKLEEGWDVWIFGGPKEKPIAKNIQEYCSNMCFDLSGKTGIGEAIDLISNVDAVVANDSGLMHVAAALDVPVVAIYGATPQSFAPPLSNKSRALSLNLSCSPCKKPDCPFGHTKCLYDLKPELVLKAIADLTGR